MNISNKNKKIIATKLTTELGLTPQQAATYLNTHIKTLNNLLCLSEYVEWLALSKDIIKDIKDLTSDNLSSIQNILYSKNYTKPPLKVTLQEFILLAQETNFMLFIQENTLYEAKDIKDVLLLNQQEFDVIKNILK